MSKKIKPRAIFLISLCFIAYFLYMMIGQEKVISKQRNEIAKIDAKIEEQKALNEELNAQKDKVNSDEYVEKVAREKLGLVKPGEKIYVDMNK